MKKILPVLVVLFFSAHVYAQKVEDFLPEKPPKNAKENVKYLFAGLGLQVAGIGTATASVYIILEAAEEGIDIGLSGIGLGLVMTTAGTALIIGSVGNMVAARRSWHEIKKEQKHNGVSFHIEPTNYGVGIVCRF